MSAGRIWWIRHALPSIDAAVEPALWWLTRTGRSAARDLSTRLPADAWLIAGPETSAQQTLAPSGPVIIDDRLREVDRQEASERDLQARRRAYVGGVQHASWELRATVAARLQEVVEWSLEQRRGTPVLATHGMALTVWLDSHAAVTDAAEFWSSLEMPHVVVVDVAPAQVSLA